MGPDKKAEHRYGNRGKRDSCITENTLAAETGNHFRDNTHAGKDHYVHCRMRVEPEQVLEEKRISAFGRVKHANSEDPLEHDKNHGHLDNWCSEDEDDRRGVVGPDEQGKAEPSHAWSPHFMDRYDEVEPG